MEEINNFAKKLTEVAIGLAAISFIFYFSGYLHQLAYFESLGIAKQFLSFSYEQYVVIGISHFYFFLILFPVFLVWITTLRDIEKSSSTKSKIDEEITKIELMSGTLGPKTNEKFRELKLRYKEASEKLEIIISEFKTTNPFKVFSPVVLTFVLSIIFLILFFASRSGGSNILCFELIQFVLGILVSTIAYKEIRNYVISRQAISVVRIFAATFYFVILMPVFSGILDASNKNIDGNFVKFDITTHDEVLENLNLITVSESTYVFSDNVKKIYIPESRIKKMESLDLR